MLTPLPLTKEEQLAGKCDHGDAKSCEQLGQLYAVGDGVSVDSGKALRLFEKACTSNNSSGCFRLGLFLESAPEGYRNLGRAMTIYDKACKANNYFACTNLAFHYWNGDAGPANHARAMDLYKKACANNEPQACHNISLNYRSAMPPDTIQMNLYKDKACLAGFPYDCVSLGDNYRYAEGGLPFDIQKALTYYDRACTTPDPRGGFSQETGCQDAKFLREFCLGPNPHKACFPRRPP